MRKPGGTRKLKGGKYVARGSYGCVFRQPPLKCLSEATRRNNSYISKLMTKEDAKEEYDQSKFIRFFDPTEKYFVTAEKICKFDFENIKASNQLKKCDLEKVQDELAADEINKTRLLLYKDAGIDIHKLHLEAKEYIPFYKSIVNILEGLQFLHSKGIIHHDIKSDNIITRKKTNGNFQTRFIDVGFVCTFIAPPDEKLMNIYNIYNKCNDFRIFRKKARSYGPFYEFFYYSPNENSTRFEDKDEYKKVYERWVGDITNYVGMNLPFMKEDGKTPMISYTDVIKDIEEAWGDNINKKFTIEDSGADFVLKITSQGDIFSLGLFLLRLQRKFVHHKIKQVNNSDVVYIERTKEMKKAGAPKEVLVSNLTSYGISDTIAQWHSSVAEKITIPIFHLMKKMCNLNPIKAIELTEVIEIYKTILNDVETLYKPNLVYKGVTAVEDNPIMISPTSSSSKTSTKPTTKKTSKKTTSQSTSTRKFKTRYRELIQKKKKAIRQLKETLEKEIRRIEKKVKEIKHHKQKLKNTSTKFQKLEDMEEELEEKLSKLREDAEMKLEDARDDLQEFKNELTSTSS